jgi:hypothetical protein
MRNFIKPHDYVFDIATMQRQGWKGKLVEITEARKYVK